MEEDSYEDLCNYLLASIPEIQYVVIFDINGNCIASATPEGIDEKSLTISAAMALITTEKTMTAFELSQFEQLFVRAENGYVIMMVAGSNRVLAVRTSKDIKLGTTFLDMKRSCDKIVNLPYSMPESKINLKAKLNELEMQTSEQYKIFFSYASVDCDHFQIEKIAQILESKHSNIKTRYYKRDIKPGQDLIDYMEEGVMWSNIFIWFHSENSSQSSAVDKEYKMAEYEKKKIITITEDFNKLRPAVRVTWVVSHINDVDKMCDEIYRGIKS
jgi:predicted regulator of Ras-like GTPase activity (Roadblock/LC7/MglB family)